MKRCRRCRATLADGLSPRPPRLSRALALPQRPCAGPVHRSFTSDKRCLRRRERPHAPPRWRSQDDNGRACSPLPAQTARRQQRPINRHTHRLLWSVPIDRRGSTMSGSSWQSPANLRTSLSGLSPPRKLMLSTAVGRDCGADGWERRAWTVLGRLGAVWVTAWPLRAGGTRYRPL